MRPSFSHRPGWGESSGCLGASLSPPLLLLPPPNSEDVSLHLSPFLFACPAVKTGGVSFIPAHKVPRGERGFNACVWTQAIIPNYCFSFELASPAGEPADEHALILPSRLISVGFVGQAGQGGRPDGFHLNVSLGADSNALRWEN